MRGRRIITICSNLDELIFFRMQQFAILNEEIPLPPALDMISVDDMNRLNFPQMFVKQVLYIHSSCYAIIFSLVPSPMRVVRVCLEPPFE